MVALVTGQIDLLGGPDIPRPRKAPEATDQPSTDDLDLIIAVVKACKDPGYVVIGPAERVYRRTDDGPNAIDKVPDYINGAVHQLIDQGLLTIGGQHLVEYHGRRGGANSVLVPRKTRDKVHHWESLARPEAWGPRRYSESPQTR